MKGLGLVCSGLELGEGISPLSACLSTTYPVTTNALNVPHIYLLTPMPSCSNVLKGAMCF